jgi:hypothetical protein
LWFGERRVRQLLEEQRFRKCATSIVLNPERLVYGQVVVQVSQLKLSAIILMWCKKVNKQQGVGISLLYPQDQQRGSRSLVLSLSPS